MNPLRSFIIPVKGLKIGVHEFSYILDHSFFKAVNAESEIQAELKVSLSFDKRPTMYILDISITGDYHNACDRCLENIAIPIEIEHQLYIKKGLSEDEADVVYLEHFDDELDIARYLYEYAVISFPLTNVIDCDEMKDPPCNMDMLAKWDAETKAANAEEENKGSIWDELNNLNLE